jgi:hypothetical protein
MTQNAWSPARREGGVARAQMTDDQRSEGPRGQRKNRQPFPANARVVDETSIGASNE